MAEESQNEAAPRQARSKVAEAFMSVPADEASTCPEPATARLTWHGSN